MAVQARHTDVTATVTLWVPLDASGNLKSGVESVLDNVEGVDQLTVSNVTSVQPRATDIQVTADVGARMTVPVGESNGETVRDRLADGFGVMDVDRCSVETA